MAVRDQIQTQAAAAGKAGVDMQGAKGVYNDPGQGTVTLSINPQALRQKPVEVDGVFVEQLERDFLIPMQTGFPQAGGPRQGALLVFESQNWWAVSWAIDSVKAAYKGTFQCDDAATRLGVKA